MLPVDIDEKAEQTFSEAERRAAVSQCQPFPSRPLPRGPSKTSQGPVALLQYSAWALEGQKLPRWHGSTIAALSCTNFTLEAAHHISRTCIIFRCTRPSFLIFSFYPRRSLSTFKPPQYIRRSSYPYQFRRYRMRRPAKPTTVFINHERRRRRSSEKHPKIN